MTETIAAPAFAVPARTNLPYRLTYGVIVIAVIGINLFTRADYYADFDAYVYYLDSLVHFPELSALYFEPLSNAYLLSAHWLTNSVLSAVVVAHYVLAIIFLLALARVFPPERSSWQALLFTFAILGPLLALVTMRATPAYFLIAIGVTRALDRRPTAWLYLVAASLFHISSLLAAGPMALVYFQRNLPRFLRSDRSRAFYAILAFIIIAASASIPNIRDTLLSIVQIFPAISKYAVYTDAESEVINYGHYVFLAFMSVITLTFLLMQGEEARRLNIYVITSLVIYIVLFFSASPVAAFRQTPFWLMPMIAVFPWSRLAVGGLLGPMFALFCAGLFVFQFGQVYQ